MIKLKVYLDKPPWLKNNKRVRGRGKEKHKNISIRIPVGLISSVPFLGPLE